MKINYFRHQMNIFYMTNCGMYNSLRVLVTATYDRYIRVFCHPFGQLVSAQRLQ